jgi:environmental stress-induced protein Ves
MRITHLRRADYYHMQWKNGGGWTTELARSSIAEGADFSWRISIADIETDGAFSAFPQCDRLIALLDGNGMRLDFDAAASVLLDRRLRFVSFSGDWTTHGTLLDGPVRDFNVIARRDLFRIEALHRPLLGPMLFTSEPQTTWLIYLAAGDAQIRGGSASLEISTGESVLLEPNGSAERIVLDGGGAVVLVKLTPLDVARNDT